MIRPISRVVSCRGAVSSQLRPLSVGSLACRLGMRAPSAYSGVVPPTPCHVFQPMLCAPYFRQLHLRTSLCDRAETQQADTDTGAAEQAVPDATALANEVATLKKELETKTTSFTEKEKKFSADLKRAQETNKQLEVTTKELKEKVLTQLADMENVRQRARDDVDKAKKFSVSGFAKEVLDVADDLDRALENVPTDLPAETQSQVDSVLEGVRLTHSKLLHVLSMQGVQKYDSAGLRFDPNYHDALFEIEPTEDMKAGTVGHVMKPGYTMYDRVLRPAQVGAVRGVYVPTDAEASEGKVETEQKAEAL